MSIVLADDPKDTTLEGKMKVIVEALALAEKGGITKKSDRSHVVL